MRLWGFGKMGLAPAPCITDLVQRGLVVLQAVRLVDHEVVPLHAAQRGRILEHQLEGGDQRLKLVQAPRGAAGVELKVPDHLRGAAASPYERTTIGAHSM